MIRMVRDHLFGGMGKTAMPKIMQQSGQSAHLTRPRHGVFIQGVDPRENRLHFHPVFRSKSVKDPRCDFHDAQRMLKSTMCGTGIDQFR